MAASSIVDSNLVSKLNINWAIKRLILNISLINIIIPTLESNNQIVLYQLAGNNIINLLMQKLTAVHAYFSVLQVFNKLF